MTSPIAEGMTPSEYADDKILTLLRGLHGVILKENPDNLKSRHLRRVTNRIARTHNRILEDSGLDGIAIDLRFN